MRYASDSGLLHNWGVGLHSLGTHTADAQQAAAALEHAAARLRDSAGFGRGDPAPLNALGDVRMAQVRSICGGCKYLSSGNADELVWLRDSAGSGRGDSAPLNALGDARMAQISLCLTLSHCEHINCEMALAGLCELHPRGHGAARRTGRCLRGGRCVKHRPEQRNVSVGGNMASLCGIWPEVLQRLTQLYHLAKASSVQAAVLALEQAERAADPAAAAYVALSKGNSAELQLSGYWPDLLHRQNAREALQQRRLRRRRRLLTATPQPWPSTPAMRMRW